MQRPDISIIIPAKNEEKSITPLYLSLKKVLTKLKKQYEIIFIEDGSTDNTFIKMQSLTRKDKRVKIIKIRGNVGKSIGLQLGFSASKGSIVMTMDADLQDDPDEIPKFLKKLSSGADLVTGWKKKRLDPLSKTIPSYVVNYITAKISGLKIHDTNCGFKAYKRIVIENIHLHGDLYRFIPILAHRQNFKIEEIVINHKKRKYGKSKYGIMRLFSGWLDILTIFFLIRYLRRPAHFFGGIGVFAFSIGFAIGIYITYLRITTGSIQYHHPLLFLGMLLMIIGVQLISTGLLAEFIIQSQGKQDYSSFIERKINFS